MRTVMTVLFFFGLVIVTGFGNQPTSDATRCAQIGARNHIETVYEADVHDCIYNPSK